MDAVDFAILSLATFRAEERYSGRAARNGDGLPARILFPADRTLPAILHILAILANDHRASTRGGPGGPRRGGGARSDRSSGRGLRRGRFAGRRSRRKARFVRFEYGRVRKGCDLRDG